MFGITISPVRPNAQQNRTREQPDQEPRNPTANQQAQISLGIAGNPIPSPERVLDIQYRAGFVEVVEELLLA